MVERPNNPAANGDSEGNAFAKARELQRGLIRRGQATAGNHW